MKLISIEAENFRSFERLELDLRGDGLTAVVGDNGAGKSTIFAAVEWALYGSKRGAGSLAARRDDCPEDRDCFVEVQFELGDRAYGVRRTDRKTARLFDAVTQDAICTGLDATSRQIATLLGLSRDMFRATFYARQKEVVSLESDNERRIAQVELLLGIERLRRAAREADDKVKKQQLFARALETEVPDVTALSAEAERVERDAQQAAPRVQIAEQKLDEARRHKDKAAEALEALRIRERTMIERSARAQSARADAEHETRAADALRTQVTEADDAAGELAQLEPVAADVEPLTAHERDLDHQREDHERIAALRADQHAALARAARLSDQLAAVRARLAEFVKVTLIAGSAEHDPAEPNDVEPAARASDRIAVAVEQGERQLEHLRDREQALDKQLRNTDAELGRLREELQRGQRATLLDEQLIEHAQVELALQDALERWAQQSAQRTQLDGAIRHDTEHREKVLAGEKQAACPTCKRAYDDGELDDIVAAYDRDIEAARKRLAQLDIELVNLKSTVSTLRTNAERLRALAADRRALGEVGDAATLAAIRAQLTDVEEQHDAVIETLGVLGEQRAELSETLPMLRKRARDAVAAEREASELAASHRETEGQIHVYAQQLAGAHVNGYKPDEHTRVRTQLAQAIKASQRCAALRAKADGLELLRRRLGEQEARTVTAAEGASALEAAVVEVAVTVEQLDAACRDVKDADAHVERAGQELIDANRQASTDSDAVATARARLAAAREQAGHLRAARSELRLRGQVAAALSALREDATRRARPTLEQETSHLLAQVTRGRYTAVQMSDTYALEIVDGRTLYPVRRFSGGEQDLAALCLRLALSRILARSRGAETGFVLLDEVFGSQDPERRRALLAQLRALAEAEFRQVFVVSHTTDVVEHCDMHIDVTRDDDRPSVAVGPRR